MSASDSEQARRIVALEKQVHDLMRDTHPRPVVARAATATAQSIPNTTPTIVDYNIVTFDADSHLTTGAAWRFTAKVAGYYQVNAAILFAATTTWALVEWGNLALYKNAVYYSNFERADGMDSSAAGLFKCLRGSDVVQLAVGDSIDVRASHISGGALTLFNGAVFNYVSIAKVN